MSQLLLAGGDGPPVAGLLPYEPAARALLDAMVAAGVSHPPPDVMIPADRLVVVVDGVRKALRDRRAATSLAGVAGAWDATDVDILGERVRIRLRDEGQYALKRFADLYRGLEDLAVANARVALLAVPVVDDLDRAILHVVRDGAVPRADLSTALRTRLVMLVDRAVEPQHVADLQRQADAAADPEVLTEHLTRLRSWDLVTEDERGAVSATRKLRRIRL